MGRKHLSLEVNFLNNELTRMTVPNEDSTIEGGDLGIWNLTTPTAARVLTVQDYDQSRFAQYHSEPPFKPHVMIRSKVKCDVFNVVVKDVAGNTLYTFAADNTAAEEYCILRQNSSKEWELA